MEYAQQTWVPFPSDGMPPDFLPYSFFVDTSERLHLVGRLGENVLDLIYVDKAWEKGEAPFAGEEAESPDSFHWTTNMAISLFIPVHGGVLGYRVIQHETSVTFVVRHFQLKWETLYSTTIAGLTAGGDWGWATSEDGRTLYILRSDRRAACTWLDEYLNGRLIGTRVFGYFKDIWQNSLWIDKDGGVFAISSVEGATGWSPWQKPGIVHFAEDRAYSVWRYPGAFGTPGQFISLGDDRRMSIGIPVVRKNSR